MAERNEETLWQGTYSSKAMAGAWILSFLLFTICSVLALVFVDDWRLKLLLVVTSAAPGVYCLLVAWYRSMTLYYAITTRRLVCRTGLIDMDIDRVALMAITDVSCRQRGLDRIFGIGSITIQSSDTSDPVFTMRGIEEVHDVLRILDEACTLERAGATKINV